MRKNRLGLAFSQPPAGCVLLMGATADADLSAFEPARCRIVQPHFPDYRALQARGFDITPTAGDAADLAVVFLPRAKALAHAMIHQAATILPAGGTLWIDGQKTDGVDSILREIRALTPVSEVISKAHGKIFCVNTGGWVPERWKAQPHQAAPGFTTWPGVFSADGVDPGSALLAQALPDTLPAHMVDLGAGWGWLAAQLLTRPTVETVDLVEADHTALTCARSNIRDARARFHWADARDVTLPGPVGGVVMNPPFHDGRAADPGLGRAFIATAARLLGPAGRLWMVANRHLPYEAELGEDFTAVTEIGGDSRFKVIEASGARRARPRDKIRMRR